MGVIMMAMRALENITDLARKVTIFNAMLNIKVAWDTVSEVAIHKCFRWCNIHDDMGQPQAANGAGANDTRKPAQSSIHVLWGRTLGWATTQASSEKAYEVTETADQEQELSMTIT